MTQAVLDEDEEPTPSPGRSRFRLPPPSKGQRVGLALALLFLAGSVGYAVGVPRDPGASSVDVGFLQDMIAHHEQAVEMASNVVSAGAEPVVRSFAKEVLVFQQYEIGLMEAYLQRWGHPRYRPGDTAMGWMGTPVPIEEMPGMASRALMGALGRSSGREMDALFVAMMTEHHRGGVDMAQVAANRAKDGYVRALAERIARNQRIEIKEMDAARRRLAL